MQKTVRITFFSARSVLTEERDMKGAKVVTFALDTKKLKPGRYHVEGPWGGNNAADKEFDLIPKGAK